VVYDGYNVGLMMPTQPVLALDQLEGPEFDFDAGDLSLDYVNTAEFHASAHPQEYLNSYFDFLRWANLGKVVANESGGSLLEYAVNHPQEAENALADVLELREALFRIFTARVLGQGVAAGDLHIFNRYLGEAMAHRRVEFFGGVAHWAWEEAKNRLDRPLWTIVSSAADLLTSEDGERLGQCQDDRGCGWLFIDVSKNHSRRWCSMESCGNRAKAQRHYGRKKQVES
jgi:predicted RNA-binding Zn ribbon-like protein